MGVIGQVSHDRAQRVVGIIIGRVRARIGIGRGGSDNRYPGYKVEEYVFKEEFETISCPSWAGIPIGRKRGTI